jgi:hypothetical protein
MLDLKEFRISVAPYAKILFCFFEFYNYDEFLQNSKIGIGMNKAVS